MSSTPFPSHKKTRFLHGGAAPILFALLIATAASADDGLGAYARTIKLDRSSIVERDDGIVISGQASELTGIEIVDGNVSFQDAKHLALADTHVSHANLKEKGAVATVGPAAENGVRFASYARQTEGCANRVSERIVGTKGVAEPTSGVITGANPFRVRESPNPYVQEHTDLIAAIRTGKPLNEGKRLAESTMSAICGRMSAYTGREISWKWLVNASKLDLSPPAYELGDLPVRPVAIPGKTQLV